MFSFIIYLGIIASVAWTVNHNINECINYTENDIEFYE